jgi:hypothetical protein
MKLLCAQVIPGFEKHPQDAVSLRALLEPFFAQKPGENTPGSSEGITADAGCVVDTLLWRSNQGILPRLIISSALSNSIGCTVIAAVCSYHGCSGG